MARTDVYVDDLRLQGRKFEADVEEAILIADLERTIDGASTVRLTINDEDRRISQSNLFNRRVSITLDTLPFELVQVAKQGDQLGLVFESGGVADLRRKDGFRAARKKTTTRTKFARTLVNEVKHLKFVGEEGERNLVALVRGGKDNPGENSWDCIQRLAADRQWRAFEADGTVFFGSDDWLGGRGTPVTIQEHKNGVEDVNWEWDNGKRAESASFNCIAGRWESEPGHAVRIKDQSSITDGIWLIESISRSLFDDLATINLTRQTRELPEPKPETNHNDATGSSSSAGSSVSGTSDEGFQWPVQGPVTSGFGDDRGDHAHAGIDIGIPNGTSVYAAKDGIISIAGTLSGYGVAIYCEHEGGYQTRYGHLQTLLVRAGQSVKRGDKIALSNNTGTSTGPHLHFEIRVGGAAVNPLSYLP